MNFNDIFKNSFLNDFSYTIDTKTIIINLAITAVFAVYIYFIYRTITRKTFYSKNFNISLIAMAIITAAIIITIQSNVVLSLGMVGALSIVRFRTAIKDPLDLVFLYWSISVGIICGAGLSAVAAVLCLIVTASLFLSQVYPVKRLSKILVINCSAQTNEDDIISSLRQYSKSYKIKSQNLTPTALDLVIEVNIMDNNKLLRDLMKIEGVHAASLLAHDGEITAS